MKNKNVFSLIFLSCALFALSFISLISISDSKKVDFNTISPDVPLLSSAFAQNEYYGEGQPVGVFEHALNFSSYTGLDETSTLFGTVPVGWQAYNARIDISNLLESGQWLTNSNCEGQSPWETYNGGTDTSDVEAQYNATHSYGGNPGGSLEIKLLGWTNTTTLNNGELNGTVGASLPDNWDAVTPGAYGGGAPDIYECDYPGGEDIYHVVGSGSGGALWNPAVTESSVKVNQTIQLPSDGDWVITKAELEYHWHVLDIMDSSDDDGIRVHLRIGGWEVDGHPFYIRGDYGSSYDRQTTAPVDVTSYFLSGTSWEVEFGFAISITTTGGTDTIDGYFEEVKLTIYYQQKIDPGTDVSWNQTTSNSFAGRDITSATLDLALLATENISSAPYSHVWAQVGSGTEWATPHYLSIGGVGQFLDDITTVWAEVDSIDLTWDLKSLTTKSNINIRFGLTLGGLSFGLDKNVSIYFDYIRLNIISNLESNHSNINFQVYDANHSSYYTVLSTEPGSGILSIPDTWDPGSHQFSFQFGGNILTVSFDAYLQMNETRYSIATSNFTARDPYYYDDIEWFVNFNPLALIDLSHYEFTVEVPNDWDPDRIWLPGSIISYELQTLPGVMVITEPAAPANNTLEFYDPFVQDRDGLWRLRFYAPNYAHSIKSQIYSGTWIDSSLFYPTNNTQTNVLLKNDSMIWSQGLGSQTIYRILNEDQNPIEQTINYTEAITAQTEINVSWTVGSNEIGTYKAVYRWNDSQTGLYPSKIGYNYTVFEVWRKTSIQYSIEGSPNVYNNTYLQPQFLKFKTEWSDLNSGNPVTNGTFHVEHLDRSGNPTIFTNFVGIQGNYTVNLPTANVQMGNQIINLTLSKYYYDSQLYSYKLNQTIDVSTEVLTPQIKIGSNTYYAESLEINDYNITCKFYDEYRQEYIVNGTQWWTNVEVTAQYGGGPIEYFNIDSANPEIWFFTVDTSTFTGVRDYNITMRVLESSPFQYPFEIQSFNVRIQIVYSQTDLDAAKTSITYPPAGTGDGWTRYNNATDEYEASIYWGETFQLRIFYENITAGSDPIIGATVQLIGWPNSSTLLNLVDQGSGYYEIQLIANDTHPTAVYYLYVNASKLGYLTQTIHLKLNVISRTTYLTREPITAYELIPWDDAYYILFTWNDTVPTPQISMINGTPNVFLSVSNYLYYNIFDYANGSYGVILYANQSLGEHNIIFEFTRSNYDTQRFTLTFNIESIHTIYLVDPPLVSMAYGDEYNITVTYYDLNHNVGIDGTIVADWFVGYYQTFSFNNGTWIISINATSLGDFTLNVSFSQTYYQSQNFEIQVSVREIITLLVYDPPGSVPITSGGNITLMLYYQDLDHDLPITGAIVEMLSLWNGSQFLNMVNPFNWTCYDLGDGTYDVEISIDALKIGDYSVSINISKPFYIARKYYNISFNIRQAYTQLTSPEAPSSLIPKGLYNITLNYRNRETGQGFANSSGEVFLTFDFPENATIYPSIVNVIVYQKLGHGADGYYYLELNLTSGSLGADDHFLIHVYMSAGVDVEDQELNITITITPAGTVIGYETPDPVVWNTNVSFIITYKDISGGAIPGASPSDISINWTLGYYTITYEGSGEYRIELNTSAFPPSPQEYFILVVNASHVGYTQRTVYINIRVRSIDSIATYIAPPGTPYNEIASFSFRYWDTFNNQPINGSQISISASYLTSDLGTYFSWEFDSAPGYFILHINTSYWNILGDLRVDIAVTWVGEPYYQNQTDIAVLLPIQARTTDLSYQNLESTPFNDTVSYNVTYRDLVAAGIPGIVNANVSVWYSGQLWSNGSDFAWVSESGSGVYDIYINSTKLSGIGDFIFTIWANWSSIPFYANRSISVSVTITQRTTEIIYEIEGSVAYSNVALVNITYSDLATSLGISNTTYYGGGHVRINLYYQGELWTNESDFAWVAEVSEMSAPGLYMLFINTSYLMGLGSFQFSVMANWESPPFFQNKSRLITIITRSPNTDLSYAPPPSTPIGDLVNLTLYYINLDIAGEGIDNSTNNIIITANLTSYVVYDLNSVQKGQYSIEIDTSDPALNNIGTFFIQVNVQCLGSPYYSNKSRLIFLSIKEISTSLVVRDYERVTWWNHNITVLLTYNDTDHSGIGIGSPTTVLCGWGSWSYIEVGQGELHFQLNTSVPLGDYTTWFYLEKTNYKSQNISIPFTIREIYTNYQTNSSFVSNYAWGYNFTAEIEYLDVDNSGLVSDLTLSDITVEGDAPWGAGGAFSVQIVGGKFYIAFNTSQCVEDITYTINISLSKTYYQTQSFQIRASVIYPPSAIFIIDISPSTTLPWGQELRVYITYNDTETYSGISNGSGDVNIWLEGGSGEPGWPTSNYTIHTNTSLGPGYYTIVINTTWTGRDEGIYQLKILGNASHFREAIAITSITIRKTITDLILTQAPSVIYKGSSDNFTLWFNNTETVGTPREESLPNAIIQVWYRFPNGTMYEWDSSFVGGQYSILDLGTGEYRVTLNASTNLGIGQFLIYFNASLDSSWEMWQTHYEMGTELYNLRIIEIDTLITVVEQPSGSVAWGDNFTLRIGYNDTVNDIGILNALINVSGAGSLWTVYYNQTLADPTYLIEINSTWISPATLGNSFAVTIEASKLNYKTQQVIVYIIIRDILTTLSYDPFSQTPFNNTASTYLYYQDVVHSVSITNDTGQVQIILYNTTTGIESSITYSSFYTGTSGTYQINIDTADLPSFGTYQFNVSVYWIGQPYYQNQSTILELVVRKISTIMSITPITPIPYDNNVTIVLDYAISDFESDENGNPINNANVVLINGSNLTSYPIIYSVQYPSQTGTDGRYIIEIDKSNFQEVKSYNIWIFMNYSNCFSANSSIIFQVRNLTTAVFIDPIAVAPYGNHINVSINYMVVDTESDRNGDPILGAMVNITTTNYNLYGDYYTGNYTTHSEGSGNYIIQIWNHSLPWVNGSVNLDITVGGVLYYVPITSQFTVQTRNLTTAIYIFPINPQAWGNSVNVTVRYQVFDSASQFLNNRGIEGAAINITTAGLNVYGTDYIVTESGDGYYHIYIFNHSVDQIRNDYRIDVKGSQVAHYDEVSSFSTFEIRNLTTALYVYAIAPVPIGNGVNLTVHYKVQDPGSLHHNNRPITGSKINITTLGYTYGVQYWVSEIGNGDYRVTISNLTLIYTKTYVLNFKAGGILNHTEATTTGSFDIRQLITIIEIQPVTPVPYGNGANITLIYKISDPDSYYWHGFKIPAAILGNQTKINISTPNYDIFGDYASGNYTSNNLSADGYYWVYIYNHSIDAVTSYTIEIKASGIPQFQNATASITFEVRPLYTFLSYNPLSAIPWGDNVTVELHWVVKDTASDFHDMPIEAGELEITNKPWLVSTDYTYKDLTGGNYLLNISSTAVDTIQLYTVMVTLFDPFGNIYYNMSTNVLFQIRQVHTMHTVVINETYTGESFSGWPWGIDMPLMIYYNYSESTHPSWELVPNSNITVFGQAGTPYESGNFYTINYGNGSFSLIIDGAVGEHGVLYTFDVILYTTSGNYQNDSTARISVWFRKSTAQIFFLAPPPLFIPWGDNITLIFSYNNTESSGTPGIPNADVNITVDPPAAVGTYNFGENLSLGDGAWYLTMNTTWAPVSWYNQVEVTFTISALSNSTIIAYLFYTVIIQPITTELKVNWYDASIWLEQSNSFNLSMRLLDRSHYNSTSHEYNPIENNSYWMDGGSMGQYDNLRFNITTREGQYSNYTWYWGNVTLEPIPSNGYYTLRFHLNQTPDYPEIQELLGYTVFVDLYGDHIALASTQITLDMRIHTHMANVTFSWTYANFTVAPNANISQFDPYNDTYVYGDLINISMYFWDLDSGAFNPGIYAAQITCNWTDPVYYRVFNQYQLHDYQDEWLGIYTIQIDTNMFENIIGNYTLQINATLETYQRAFVTIYPSYNIQFKIDPVPVNISLVQPIYPTPITGYVRLYVNFTNLHSFQAIYVRIWDVDIPSVAGPMGANKWAVSTGVPGELELFIDSNVLGLGWHTVTIRFNKTNYELLDKNYTVQVRLIYTEIMIEDPIDLYPGDENLTGTYRYNYSLQFYYNDDPEALLKLLGQTWGYNPVGRIPLASFNITDWREHGGSATPLYNEVPSGIYKFTIQMTANVNITYGYLVNIVANRTNFAPANKTLLFNVTKADIQIDLIQPKEHFLNIYKLGSEEIEILFLNEFGEPMLGETVTFIVKDDLGATISTGIFEERGDPGHYVATISTNALQMQESYTLTINATSASGNYKSRTTDITLFIKPIWEHPVFIIVMIAAAAVCGAYAYRKVKWVLLPREIKAIEIAKKQIKKGKTVKLPFRDIIDRELMFSMMFADNWQVIGIKPPKLVRPEVVLFASEMSAILRTRMTTPEAETMINTLRTMSAENAERYLGDMKVPPEATRRLLIIAGLIEKERLEVINFAQVLGEIKAMEISYSQAEEIMKTLQSKTPFDADKYLEAMVIPAEDRQHLLDMIGMKPFTAPKKVKEPKKEKAKEKEKEIKEKPMDIEEIRKALDKIEGLSVEEKESLIKDMQKLTLKEQQEILKNLGG